MKKKILALALIVCMLGVAIVSSTLAYFTDSDEAVNVFTVGNIDIELTEEVGVFPTKDDADNNRNEYKARVVKFGDDSAVYTNIMPTNYLKKEVTVTNTGKNDAYVRVAVIVGNFSELSAAVDVYYEDKTVAGVEYPKNGAEIEAIYDEIFAGWGVTYQKTAANGNDLRCAINKAESSVYTSLQNNTDATLIGIDTYRTTDVTIRGYELLTSKNNTYGLKGTNNNCPSVDDITGAILKDYELMYVYYLRLNAGASATLFEGLNVPAYFDNEQMQFFEDLEIEVYADAIQVEGIADAETAFDHLAKAHPLASIERLHDEADEMLAYVGDATVVNDAKDANDALANGDDVVLADSIKVEELGKNPYGGTVGLKQENGGTLDGNDNDVDANEATWGIITYGGTIKNVKITNAQRGIVIYSPTEDVILENVYIDGPGYAINTGEYPSTPIHLYATNTTLKGWSSFAGLASNTFTNCTFGENTTKYWQNMGYDQDYDRLIRPYTTTTFTNCVFEKDFYIDLSVLGYEKISGVWTLVDSSAVVTFDNCTVNGVKITEANYASLLGAIELPDYDGVEGPDRALSDFVIFK